LLIFINDLDPALVNMVLKFADDTKVVGKVNNYMDRETIQHDFHKLLDWSDKLLCVVELEITIVYRLHGKSGTVSCDGRV